MSGFVSGKEGYVLAAYAAYAISVGLLIGWVALSYRARQRGLSALGDDVGPAATPADAAEDADAP